MAQARTVLDPEIEARGFDKIRSTVEVDLTTDGRLVQAADERYRGGPDRPFSREELHEKFTECAVARAFPEQAIDRNDSSADRGARTKVSAMSRPW